MHNTKICQLYASQTTSNIPIDNNITNVRPYDTTIISQYASRKGVPHECRCAHSHTHACYHLSNYYHGFLGKKNKLLHKNHDNKIS